MIRKQKKLSELVGRYFVAVLAARPVRLNLVGDGNQSPQPRPPNFPETVPCLERDVQQTMETTRIPARVRLCHAVGWFGS